MKGCARVWLSWSWRKNMNCCRCSGQEVLAWSSTGSLYVQCAHWRRPIAARYGLLGRLRHCDTKLTEWLTWRILTVYLCAFILIEAWPSFSWFLTLYGAIEEDFVRTVKIIRHCSSDLAPTVSIYSSQKITRCFYNALGIDNNYFLLFFRRVGNNHTYVPTIICTLKK